MGNEPPMGDIVPKRRIMRDDDFLEWARGYLGNFFVYFSPEEEEKVLKVLPRLQNVYLRGSNKGIKKTVAVLLWKWGFQDYRYLTVSELLDQYLGKSSFGEPEDQSRRSCFDLESPLCILHHVAYMTPNKQTEALISQFFAERYNRGLTTIILDEANLQEVRKALKSLSVNVMETRVDSILASGSESQPTRTHTSVSPRRPSPGRGPIDPLVQ